eukprot:6949392-Alexandrium_andersonii.AAC.1
MGISTAEELPGGSLGKVSTPAIEKRLRTAESVRESLGEPKRAAQISGEHQRALESLGRGSRGRSSGHFEAD